MKLFRNGRNQAVRIPREFELRILVTDDEREFASVEGLRYENWLR
jgi:virulence-associated protein VagC